MIYEFAMHYTVTTRLAVPAGLSNRLDRPPYLGALALLHTARTVREESSTIMQHIATSQCKAVSARLACIREQCRFDITLTLLTRVRITLQKKGGDSPVEKGFPSCGPSAVGPRRREAICASQTVVRQAFFAREALSIVDDDLRKLLSESLSASARGVGIYQRFPILTACR